LSLEDGKIPYLVVTTTSSKPEPSWLNINGENLHAFMPNPTRFLGYHPFQEINFLLSHKRHDLCSTLLAANSIEKGCLNLGAANEKRTSPTTLKPRKFLVLNPQSTVKPRQ